MTPLRIYFIPGLMGTGVSNFAPQIRAWQKQHTLAIIDLPGHGKNPTEPKEPVLEQIIEIVCARIEQGGPGHVVGISFVGGSVAVHLGRRYPELCSSIVVTGYVPRIDGGAIAVWHKGFLALVESNPGLADSFRRLHGDRWRNSLEVVGNAISSNYPEMSDADLEAFRVPLLVINGGLKSLERNAAVQMAERNHLIQAGVIPGVGHIPNLEAPEIFNMMVERFWAALQAPRTADKAWEGIDEPGKPDQHG